MMIMDVDIEFKSNVPSGDAQGCEEQFSQRFLLQSGQLLLLLHHEEHVLLPRSAKGWHGAQRDDHQGWRTAIKCYRPSYFRTKS